MSAGSDAFKAARALLLRADLDDEEKRRRFRWPQPEPFNWALDWFDAELAGDPAQADRPALRLRDGASGREEVRSFGDLSRRSAKVASLFRRLELARGDRILVMLGPEPALWEVLLAAFKAGVTVIPASTLLTAVELADRLSRGRARAVVASPGLSPLLDRCAFGGLRIVPGGAAPSGWRSLDEADAEADEPFRPDRPTEPDDPLLLYFTSGTTALPKLVLHTHRSYPIGSLSTLRWLGLRPGDMHLNVSSPGWAKHAWSSLFAPWTAGATVAVLQQPRFEPGPLLSALEEMAVTTVCAPPTVWRHLASHGLGPRPAALREMISSGEPLNAGIIETVERQWGLRVRDGYGQTETTALVGHMPDAPGLVGSMGRPLPGYDIALIDAEGRPAAEGEICLRLSPERPAGLTPGTLDAAGQLTGVGTDLYRTGDVARRNADGTLTFVGRVDDVFKSSDYRISPFELESALVAHEAVREAAVVPMPDALRLAVPRAFVLLREGVAPDAATAASLFAHLSAILSPYKRVRQIVFVSALPKTLSGKIRRRQLRETRSEEELARFDEPARTSEAPVTRSS